MFPAQLQKSNICEELQFVPTQPEKERTLSVKSFMSVFMTILNNPSIDFRGSWLNLNQFQISSRTALLKNALCFVFQCLQRWLSELIWSIALLDTNRKVNMLSMANIEIGCEFENDKRKKCRHDHVLHILT